MRSCSPQLRDTPPYLLGKPVFENWNMNGSINAAATANKDYVLIYGDIRQSIHHRRPGSAPR